MQSRGNFTFSGFLGTFGVVMIALGIAWLLADNWHVIPSFVKVLILAALTFSALWGSVFLKEKGYERTGKAVLILGAFMYTLSVFLIAQIYSTDVTLQGTAWLFLLCAIGVIALAYLTKNATVFWIGLVEFCVWLVLQFFALVELTRNVSPAYMVMLFLVVGMLFYGLALHHRIRKHIFAAPLRFFTAFYILLFAYILSFQSVLPMLWSGETINGSALIFLVITAIVALVVFISSIGSAGKLLDKRELIGVLTILVLLLVTLVASYAVRDTMGYCTEKYCGTYTTEETCASADTRLQCNWQIDTFDNNRGYCNNIDYNYNQLGCSDSNNNHDACVAQSFCQWNPGSYWDSNGGNAPTSVWIVWMFANLVLLVTILTVIYSGIITQTPGLVNIGIVAFGLMILTRYIGFMIDFWGRNGLSVFFIISGIILLVAGFGLEKWRLNLIGKAGGKPSKK